MIYAFGTIGFILGFAAGLAIINLFLRHYSARDLIMNKADLRWTYGVAVWIFAALGAWGGVWLYQRSIF